MRVLKGRSLSIFLLIALVIVFDTTALAETSGMTPAAEVKEMTHTEGMTTSSKADPREIKGVTINSANFPDDVFRGFVKKNYDKNPANGVLSDKEISAVYEMDLTLGYASIGDLKGLEFFRELRQFTCKGNNLKKLDMSNNKKLEKLYCGSNKIKDLDLTANSKLAVLDCMDNELKDLNLVENNKLINLECGYNKLTSLNVSKNTELRYLQCNFDALKELDVSANKKLEKLDCGNNALKKLDISQNRNLIRLICGSNELDKLEMRKNYLLKEVDADSNNIKSIDVKNHRNLEKLSCAEGSVKNIDVSGCSKLKSLWCAENDIEKIKLEGAKELKNLYCNNNKIKYMDLTTNKKLEILQCYNNALPELNLSKNTKLKAGEEEIFTIIGNQTVRGKYSHEKGEYCADISKLVKDPQRVQITDNGKREGNKVIYKAEPDTMTYKYSTGNSKILYMDNVTVAFNDKVSKKEALIAKMDTDKNYGKTVNTKMSYDDSPETGSDDPISYIIWIFIGAVTCGVLLKKNDHKN